MKKPIIGVTPLWDKEKNSYWMLPGYLEGLEEAGAILAGLIVLVLIIEWISTKIRVKLARG